MLKKPINMILYLAACTCLFFYMPRIISAINDSRSSQAKNHSNRLAAADMDNNAYYCLREVAGVQLGHIVITYQTDNSTGHCLPNFENVACPNLQQDHELLKEQQEALQNELHEQVMLLRRYADADHSGFVDDTEGMIFRDLFEFGHLVVHGISSQEIGKIVKATGRTNEDIIESLENYQKLVADFPQEIRKLFPEIESGSPG